jgi:hypothetical protein
MPVQRRKRNPDETREVQSTDLKIYPYQIEAMRMYCRNDSTFVDFLAYLYQHVSTEPGTMTTVASISAQMKLRAHVICSMLKKLEDLNIGKAVKKRPMLDDNQGPFDYFKWTKDFDEFFDSAFKNYEASPSL